MKRKIIEIDEELCNGCGICVPSCHEGAIQIINGKAKLIDDKFCDGLGDCLNDCPLGAIKIIEREAAEYDDEAVQEHLTSLKKQQETRSAAKKPSAEHGCSGGCPGSASKVIQKKGKNESDSCANDDGAGSDTPSELTQWPVQLHLLSPLAPFFHDKELIVAADCVAFAMGNFHNKLLKNKAVAIACPKLDDTTPYLDKLTAILQHNNVTKLSVAIMEVPCCRGLGTLAKQALDNSGKDIPFSVITVSVDGQVIR
ncbi:MAG: 4Fe-4S ferredoxin [Gammaproteobacteria bacterium]|nr:MAG: 4Fe-4S ferredoxin [Gammaproteobacteria bacterium]